MCENPVLTEPLSVQEFAVLNGVSWKTAKSMLQHIPGVVTAGACHQIPVNRMPATWHVVRSIGNAVTGLEISTSELSRSAASSKPNDMEQLLNERDLAIALRVSLEDLNSMVEDGSIPYVAIGGEIRFEPAKVLAAIRRAAIPNMKEIDHAKSL